MQTFLLSKLHGLSPFANQTTLPSLNKTALHKVFFPKASKKRQYLALKNYKTSHHGGSTFDLLISYSFIEAINSDNRFAYPGFIQPFAYIDQFLKAYPNRTDMWETLNKNLVTALLSHPIPTADGST